MGQEDPVGCATTKSDLSSLSSWKEQSSVFTSISEQDKKKEEDENKVSIAFGDGDLCFDMEDEQLF